MYLPLIEGREGPKEKDLRLIAIVMGAKDLEKKKCYG